jgi:hypothetical protein
MFALAAALVSLSTVQSAVARDGCPHSDNPMTSSEGFGVASCKRYVPRYHSRDHLGEGARGYARRPSADPMVWSDARWRSTLMGGYARARDRRYDLRFRRAVAGEHRIVRIEKLIVEGATHAEPSSRQIVKPRGAKSAYLRRNAETDLLERGSAFVGSQCRGVLVLTWKAGVARSQCVAGNTRIRRAPE